MEQILNHKMYGESGDSLFIVHGIFGMLDNWQYHAKLLSKSYQVVSIDARNHGKSFHAESMSYDEMAEDIVRLADHLNISKFHLLGHSMGGKIAMRMAEKSPERLRSLVVVDIAPKAYPAGHVPYFKAFLDLPLQSYHSRAQVDEAFAEYAPDKGVRQFLLKNLEINQEGGYRTKSNMRSIQKFYEEMIGDFDLSKDAYIGPVLFITGAKSAYVKEEDKSKIRDAFPNVTFEQVQRAGHWVHAENPMEFYQKLLRGLEA
jgi:pimeloyl-ACP methyl ester carboxylesterase